MSNHSNKLKSKLLLLSPYHETKLLERFAINSYSGKDPQRYKSMSGSEPVPFKSTHRNLGEWAKSVPFVLNAEIVPVCYGGSFAATTVSITKHPKLVWQQITKSLSRGNNIEEGHFAERSWAALLSKPLLQHQIAAIRNCSAFLKEPFYLAGAHFIDVEGIDSDLNKTALC